MADTGTESGGLYPRARSLRFKFSTTPNTKRSPAAATDVPTRDSPNGPVGRGRVEPLFGPSLRVLGGVEREIGDETRSGEKDDRNNDSHGYSSSNFAMADSMR